MLFGDKKDLRIYEEMTRNIKRHLRRGLEFEILTIQGHFGYSLNFVMYWIANMILFYYIPEGK